MDFDKTVELYQKHGQIKKWENDVPERHRYNKEKTWFKTVKSPRTNDYYQAQDLKDRELVPEDYEAPHKDAKGRPKRYPIDEVNCIFRKRLADNSEVLLSRHTLTGLDHAGNPISLSWLDKEWFDDILPIWRVKPENPRDRDSKMIRELDHIEHRKRYTCPYKPEEVQRLYDMRNGRCELVLMDETAGDKPPYAVENFEDLEQTILRVMADSYNRENGKLKISSC